ncbi:hypothetical protein BD310DRAFT_225146 [Dichomitus squalens]|uniref:Uncharacterized protein n=1 Tax=Dichomitus squalens TaxID=114155 RepID=A0A4V2K6K7_9APHY|nr:hypothetical protein BD310DRAFT_225146 [Dichomitus squalens]
MGHAARAIELLNCICAQSPCFPWAIICSSGCSRPISRSGTIPSSNLGLPYNRLHDYSTLCVDERSRRRCRTLPRSRYPLYAGYVCFMVARHPAGPPISKLRCGQPTLSFTEPDCKLCFPNKEALTNVSYI